MKAPRNPMKTIMRASPLNAHRFSKRPNSRPATKQPDHVHDQRTPREAGTEPALHEAAEAVPAERPGGARGGQQQESRGHNVLLVVVTRTPERKTAPAQGAEAISAGACNASLIAARRTAQVTGWWATLELNQRPPACRAGALPTELVAHAEPAV